MEKTKTPASGGLSQRDILLGLICTIFFVDTIAPVATMGPAAVTWTIIVGALFFFPGSLTVAEMGAAYPENGGFYSWIKRAFGKNWGARVSWIYWACNAIWISSVATLVVNVFCQVFQLDIPFGIRTILNLIIIWTMVFVALQPMHNSTKLTNFSAIVKLFMAAGLVIAAVMAFTRNGQPANPINLKSFIPTFDQSIIFIPALIYNFLGFEVMSGAGASMKNPARDVPKAALKNVLLVSVLYIVTVLAMLVIIPIADINIIEGVVDCYRLGFGNSFLMSALVYIIGALFVVVLFTQGMMWILAVCRVSAETALSYELPMVFSKIHKKNDSPLGSLIIAGFVASAMTIVASMISGTAEQMFWSIFSCTSVLLLIPYFINFEAYLKLKREDTITPRPYVFPGPWWLTVLLTRIGEFIVLATMVLFVWVPGQPFDVSSGLFILTGIVLTLGAGEIITRRSIANAPESQEERSVEVEAILDA